LSRNPSFARGTARLLVLAFALPATALARQQIGSFVSGERAMYIELSPLEAGADYTLEVRSVPPGSGDVFVIASTEYSPVDYTARGIPGWLGPELKKAVVFDVGAGSASGTVPTGLVGVTIYLQAVVGTPAGTRLSSMVTAHVIASGGDPGGDAVNVQFPLPFKTAQVLPSGVSGQDWSAGPVRVGVPLPIGEVFESNGVPQLTVTGGTPAAQFATLARWPDGSVKWALAEYLADVAAGTKNTNYDVDKGGGNFGGADLASVSGSATTVDTGAIRFVLDATKPELFTSFQRNGTEWFDNAYSGVPHFWDDADQEWTWHKMVVLVRRNGPVRAEVECSGSFTRSTAPDDADRIYARFLIEAYAGGSSVRVTASLRDTSVRFPQHLLFRGFTWGAKLADGGSYSVTVPQPDGAAEATKTWTGSLGSSDDASYFQGFAKGSNYELCDDANWSRYMPFIQRFGSDDYAISGVRARIAATTYTGTAASGGWTDPTVFAEPAFLETIAASGHGVLFGPEHANLLWPASLSAYGDGRFEVGILPHKDPADAHDYPLTYASSETRTFFLVAEDAASAAPIAVAKRFDFPLAARGELSVYNQAQVWPWRLVTKDEVDAYCAHAGLRKSSTPSVNGMRTVYRYSNGTGGANNNWEETRRFIQWLRGESDSAYFSSLYEALYKADKMAWTIDDDQLANCQTIRNPSAPVTPKDDFYNNSKHTFLQAVPDWAFARGETLLLDSQRNFAETLMDPNVSRNVQPLGNFVSGTYGAVVQAACAILELGPDYPLEKWTHEVCDEWAHVTYKQSNPWNIDTSVVGWQAALGTPTGSPSDPDGWMISWSSGKASDKNLYGYMTQGWTDVRGGAQAFHRYWWHLRQIAPHAPLLADLLARADDWYHYSRRGVPDDHCADTGEYYITDVVAGDAGNSDIDPLAPPGDDIDTPNPSGYSNQSVVNFLLAARPSETAYSYGVELHRSMSNPNFDALVNDPILQQFMWRYLIHYGLKQP
jgi:hypothetical protein